MKNGLFRAKIKAMPPFLLLTAVGYYVLPLLINSAETGMFLLSVILPLVGLAGSVTYGLNYSFNILYPIMAAVLFLPAVFIFFNERVWV